MEKCQKAFCVQCYDKTGYTEVPKTVTVMVHDTPVSYIEKTAHCLECGNDVYVMEIEEENERCREDAYLASVHGCDGHIAMDDEN